MSTVEGTVYIEEKETELRDADGLDEIAWDALMSGAQYSEDIGDISAMGGIEAEEQEGKQPQHTATRQLDTVKFRPIPHSKISRIHFGFSTPKDTLNMAVAEVLKKNVLQDDIPVWEGVYDAHFGTPNSKWSCAYCCNKKPNCLGHQGCMCVKYPLKVPIALETIIHYAKVVCLECGAFMLGNKTITGVKKNKLLSAYVKLTRNKKKKVKDTNKQVKINMVCPECSAEHPHIEIDKDMKTRKQYDIVLNQVYYDKDGNPEVRRLYNHKLLEAFNRVSDSTVKKVGKPIDMHPRNLITWDIIVPSNLIRPDKKVISGNRSGNDDITDFLRHIKGMDQGLPEVIPDIIDPTLADKYYGLEQMYWNMHMSSVEQNMAKKQQGLTSNMNGIAGRIPLKHGRIRNDLMGGRTFLMGRSVVSGDPRLPLDVVGIPFHVARKLYYEVVVNEHNYDECMIYFKNGVTSYPGARTIIKASTGTRHSIELLKDDVVLEVGDILLRDLIDDDRVMFGRQPSLWDLSMRCFRVKVMFEGLTFRFNPCVCVCFNADFDGDEMNVTGTSHEATAIELSITCGMDKTSTAHQDGGPIAGMFQNSLWFISKATTTGVELGQEQTMDSLALVPKRIHIDPTRASYTGRELVSFVIPEKINMRATPNMYNANLPVNYDPLDIKVEIKNGQLISGVLDKATVGQRKTGSLFHKITHMYGPSMSNAVVYYMQQLADSFGALYGSTCHIGDFLLSEGARKTIDLQTEAIIAKSMLFHKDWRHGNLVAPIDMTVNEFHERQQIEILQLTEHKQTIAVDFNMNTNNLKHANDKCGKGDSKNTESMVSAVGQQLIRGERLSSNRWRSSPYFPYFSDDPVARGFIRSCLSAGLTVPEQLAMAEEVRYGLIQIQLSTATTGGCNRETIKSLELILVDTYRRIMKQNQYIVQPLYGGQGIDQRYIIYSSIGHALISDADFASGYKSSATDFGLEENAMVDELFESEFKQLADDRAAFRESAMRIEAEYMDVRPMKSKVVVGFDIDMIILSTLNERDDAARNETKLDPVEAIEALKIFCDGLPYVFSNRFERAKKARIPFPHRTATRASEMLLRDRLCVKKLRAQGITNKMLDLILKQVYLRYMQSLIDPGMAAGIIASQSLGEMYTQFMLDSKHRSGTNIVDKLRGVEIVVARKTDAMKNPQMLLHVLPEYRKDRAKVAEIASKLEIIRFEQFIKATYVFGGETFGDPKHNLLQTQPQYIEAMKKFQSVQPPSNLSSWVIFFQLDTEMMIQRYLEMDVIIHALRAYDDKMFIVHSPESVLVPSIACYVRTSVLMKGSYRSALDALVKNVRQTVLRGVDRIIATRVVDFQVSTIQPNGEIKAENIYAIHTRGTNMEKILRIMELDVDKCLTNSVHEMAETMGIAAGYRKLITEMRVSFAGPSYAHFTIFASEMTFTGEITGITKAGAGARDNDVLPRASYAAPIPTLVDAALNGVTNKVRGASAALMLGAALEDIGTSASKIIIDEDAVREAQSSVEDLL
jgi:DNA-directed RNA polymerase II subunit RPB1